MAPKILVVDDNQELLSLLSQLFEDAGYDVLGSGKGKQALELARATAPDLAILDILLPDMMGYHLADQLRKEQPALPLIFMTGVFKGGRHAIEARQKYAAAGYFEKPFEAQQLLDAVGNVVPPQQRVEAAISIENVFEVELDIDVEDDQPQDPMELTGKIKLTGGGNLTAELSGERLMAAPMPSSAPPAAKPPPAPASPRGNRTAAVMTSKRGELKDNFPSLINAFYLAKETGELGVQRGKVKKVVYFEKGTPVFALSNLAADRLGQFLVRVGKIRPEQLTDAVAVAQQTNRRTGDVLVEIGLLKDTERLYYIGQQVKSIIYSVFAWEDGTYVLSFKDHASKESIKLDVHPANLIVRGIKKLYKPERLKRLLGFEDYLLPSLQPAYPLNEIELEKWEAEFLPHVDGRKTVAELLAFTGRPEHVVSGFLYALLALSILDRRS